jgi:hypothetical protein
VALDAALNVVAALAVADEDDTGTQGFILRSKSEESGLGRNIQFTFRQERPEEFYLVPDPGRIDELTRKGRSLPFLTLRET